MMTFASTGFGKRLKAGSVIAALAGVAPLMADPAAGTLLTGTNTINAAGGSINGDGDTGYFVQSGTLTISNATLTNFSTQGGTGSGGGAGMGGALFINSGATVTLNNVNFLANSVTGGNADFNVTKGGTLNNLFSGGTTGSTGVAGGDGSSADAFLNGGDGRDGFNGSNGGNSSSGFGGTGGRGGNGSDGDNVTLDNVSAAFDIAKAAFETAGDGTEAGLYTAIAATFTAQAGAAAGGVVTAGLSAGYSALAVEFTSLAAEATGSVTQAAIDAVFESSKLVALQTTVFQLGLSGTGGSGGSGGVGGDGGFGFGGGAGGKGGNGGDAASISGAIGGSAGDGGAGGKGGFGGGGGGGGNSGTPGEDGDSATNASNFGGGGAGGLGGFGAGVGASGADSPDTESTGGNGGSGFGGAIFVRSGATLNITGNAVFDANTARGGSGQSEIEGTISAGLTGGGVGSSLYMMKGSTVNLDAGEGNVILFKSDPFGTTIADDSASSMIPAGLTSPIASGQGASIHIKSGLVIFEGANVYSGQTFIDGGVLQAQDGEGIYFDSNITFNGGVLQSTGAFTRFVGTSSSRVQWTGDGGFAAKGGDLTVNLSGGQTLTWGANSFVTNGSKLIFGSTTADSSVVFMNAINLAGGNRTIVVKDNDVIPETETDAEIAANVDNATLRGVISNGALTVGGTGFDGVLNLAAANTYADGTTVKSGTLALIKFFNPSTGTLLSTGSLNDNGAVTVESGATFDISQVDDEAIGSLAGAGTVALGQNTLTINQSTDTTFSGVLKDGGIGGGTAGSVIKQGSGNLTVSGANTYTGSTEIKAGTVTLTGSLVSNDVSVSSGATLNNVNGGLASDTGLTNAGTINLSASDTIKTFTNNAGTLNGAGKTLTAETYNLNTGSTINANLGTGTVNANGAVALNGTSNAETFNVQTGTTTLGSAERLRDDTDLTISEDAALILGGNEKIGTLDGAGSLQNNGGRLTVDDGDFSGVVSGTGGLTKVSTGTLKLSGANTYTGSTLINAGTVELTGSLVSNVVNVASDATLKSTAGGLASDTVLTNDGTVDIADADDTILTLVNTGTVNGTATLTATTYNLNDGSEINANLGTGTVNANGAVALNGTSNAETVNVQTGTTTLGSAERLRDDTNLTVSSGATLVLGGDEKIGTFDGAGTTSLGESQLTVDDGTYSGVVTGTGGIDKVSAGLLTLSGANTYTGTTNVDVGTLTLTGSLESLEVVVDAGSTFNNVNGGLASGATLSNDGLTVLSADDTITTFNSTGTLNGTGKTLTATTYNLNDGSTINANLGTGTVNANGAVALNGTSNAETFNVQTGTTTLGSAERLRDDTDLTISEDATLILGGNEKIGTLDGAGSLQNNGGRLTVDDGDFSGVVSGTGGLTKVSTGTLKLSGDNTYTGSTLINAGTVELTGSLVSDTVNVATGASLNSTAGGLASDTVLTVNGTATLSAADAIDELLGSGSLVLDDESRLTVNQGNFSGVVSGTGGLTKVSTGFLTLSGANTYTGSTLVDAGTLTLAGSLTGTTVAVASDAVLNVTDGGLADDTQLEVIGTANFTAADTIDTLTGSGSVVLAASRLTLDQGDFSGVVSGTGGLTKVTSGTLKLSGANTYTGSTQIDAGTVELTGSLVSNVVNVASGATLASTTGGLAADTTLTNAGTVNLGSVADTIATFNSTGTLNGSAKLTATTYNLEGGSVINANLGAGTLNVTDGLTVLNGTSDAAFVNVFFGGTLTLGAAERLSDAAALFVAGTLNLSGGDETVRTLDGDGVVNINTFRLTVTEGGDYTGTINAQTLVSDGGDLVLNGGSTTNDSTNVSNGGSLGITNGGTVNTGGTTVGDGSSVNVTNGGTLNSSGGVTVGDGSTLLVDGTGTVSTTTINVGFNGTLNLTNGFTLDYDVLTGSGTVETNGATFINVGGSTVKGFLTFTGDFTNTGTLAPGNSPGLTVIGGNYTESGTLQAEFENTTPITGHDQIRVGGTVTVNSSATLVVQSFNGAVPAFGDTFQLIADLAGNPKAINGAFGSVLFDADGAAGAGAAANSAAFVFDVATGRLIATGLNNPGSTFADLGANANQRAAAAAIFGVAQGAVGPNQIDTSLLSGPGLLANQLIDSTGNPQADLARYTPDYYGALADYAFTGDRAIARRVQDRVSVTTDLSGAESSHGAVFAGMVDTNADTADNATVDRTDYFAGGDLIVAPGFKAGVAVFSHEGDISAPLGRGEADGIGGLLYARYAINTKLSAYGSIGYSTHDYDLRRVTVNGTVTGSTDATALTGTLGVQHEGWTKGRLTVAPRLGLVYSQASVDGFTETGAIDALDNDGYDSTLVTAEAGASAVWTAPVFGRTFSVELNLGVEQVLVDDNDALNVRVAGTPAITYPVQFADDAATRFTYGVNFGYNVYKTASVYAGYEGRTGDGSSRYINLGVRVGF
jgi:fibronectin-binding autotransporter adhesin